MFAYDNDYVVFAVSNFKLMIFKVAIPPIQNTVN